MPFIGLMAAASALAYSAVFSSVNASVVNGDLKVAFRVTGVDPTASAADFTVTADANALYACINRGGKNPNAANKRTTARDTVEGDVRLKANNGVITGVVSVDAPMADNFSCPPGQDKVL